MIRGTTPTHIFELPYEVAQFKDVEVTYAQHGEVVLTKRLADCTADVKKLIVELSQEETLAFNSAELIQIQLRLLTEGGKVFGSSVTLHDINKLLSTEVLS